MRRSANAKKGRYHHGELRTALIDAATELIGERGVAGFSLAEVSRRLGVTVAAPYRHFADREELLVAIAERAAGELATAVRTAAETGGDPAARLMSAGRGYIRFAAEYAPLFQALFAAGFDKTRHPELDDAARPVLDGFLGPARELVGSDAAAERLAFAVVATAHGHAVFLMDGAFGGAADPLAEAVSRAATATAAHIAGRSAFEAAGRSGRAG